MDEGAIMKNRDKLSALILDVWETEPQVNIDTIQLTDIATPHIAGYSFDGKVNGTEMIYYAACDFFKKDKNWDKSKFIKPDKELIIDLKKTYSPIYDAVNYAYPIMQDDKNLREITKIEKEKQGNFFDQLRKNYPVRREFFNYSLVNIDKIDKDSLEVLLNLGFKKN